MALVAYALMLASAVVAVSMLTTAFYMLGYLWILLLAGMMFWVDRRWQGFAGK